MHEYPKPFCLCLLVTVLLILTADAVAAETAAETAAASCAAADSLKLDTTLRRHASPRSGLDVFRLRLPEPGTLTLHVSVPRPGQAPPRLFILGEACTPFTGQAEGFRPLRRTPLDLVLQVLEPGEVFLALTPEDPTRPLPAYKLRNTFVTDGGLGRALSTQDVDEADVDVLENPLTVPGIFCEDGETDDHGDTILCATSLGLGHATTGVIGNGFGDDEDHFTFVLDHLETVAIVALGTEAHATLYDGYGHRLDRDGGADVSRIVRTLGPGRYYVRIASRSVDAAGYVLRVEAF